MKTKVKFKQMLSAILVAVLMLCTLSACGGDKNNGGSEKNSQSTQVKHTGKKIKGEIINFLGYSNGFALVELDNDDEKAYCIDKSGNIVYQLDIESGSFAWKRFINGMTITDGGICNSNGKMVYPKDIGVESFYTFALDGGYIIAIKITADYSSSKKEMGILNTDFEWIIEPSETLFAEFEEDLDGTESLDSGCYNGMIYFGMSDKFLNVETGEILGKNNIELTSDTWYSAYDSKFYDMNEEVRVDFSRYDNIIGFSNDGKYKNNKIVVKFANEDKHFWTIADEKGALLFEPLAVSVCEVDFVKFDGEYVLIYDRSNYGTCNLQCYNSNGEKLGELTINESIKDTDNISISDGVISLKVGNTYSLYTPKFEPLF